MEELKPAPAASEDHHLATERLRTQHSCLLNRANGLLGGTRLTKNLELRN